MHPSFYSLVDLLGVVYFLLFYFIIRGIAQKKASNILYKKYFEKGFLYKMIGSLGFYFIYAFYYGGGDSTTFFVNGKILNQYITSVDFTDGLSTLFSMQTGAENLPNWVANQSVYVYHEGYILKDASSMLVFRISAVISFFSLNSYLCTCLSFGFLAYLALFELFKFFCGLYPQKHPRLFVAVLAMPSVFFWGSSVNKDTICISLLSIIVVFFYRCFIQFRLSIWRIIVIILATVVVFRIKNYIVLAAFPGLLLWLFLAYQNKFISNGLKYVFGPLLILLGITASLFIFQNISSSFAEISTDALLQKAEGFQSWHSQIQEQSGGSGYSLGSVDYSLFGIIKKAPLALLITLFGPFPWQIRNLVMLISGLEGLYLFYLTVTTFFRPSAITRLKHLFSEPVLLFCISFSIILGIAVGLTSFNYGALVRFKIPLIPFYVAFLVIFEPITKRKNAKKT